MEMRNDINGLNTYPFPISSKGDTVPASRSDNSTGFKNILKESMNSASEKKKSAKESPSAVTNQRVTNTKAGTENVKENNSEKSSEKSTVETKKPTEPVVEAEAHEKVDSGKNENTECEAKSDVSNNALIEVLAKLLNLEPAKLEKLMESAGVTSEDLADAEGIQLAAEKLGDLLELDGTQKAALFKLMQKVDEKIKELLESKTFADVKNLDKSDWVRIKGAVVEITQSIKPEAKVLQETRMNIEQLSQKLQQAVESTGEKVQEDAVVKDGSSEADISRTNTILAGVQEQTGQRVVQKHIVEKNDVYKDKTAEEEKEDIVLVSQKENNAGKKAPDYGADGGKQEFDGDMDESSQFNTMLNSSRAGNVSANQVFKLQSEVNVSRQEIINQVVDKAAVLINGDKSEMVIDLKPDHLGKLSLKIVTEHGIVAAKIVAENQQVKQILESNMQLLKDSLEKQGMTVQDFSVSVRQDSSHSQSQSNTHPGKNKKILRGLGRGEGIIASKMFNDAAGRINPYDLNQSSINLTA